MGPSPTLDLFDHSSCSSTDCGAKRSRHVPLAGHRILGLNTPVIGGGNVFAARRLPPASVPDLHGVGVGSPPFAGFRRLAIEFPADPARHGSCSPGLIDSLVGDGGDSLPIFFSLLRGVPATLFGTNKIMAYSAATPHGVMPAVRMRAAAY